MTNRAPRLVIASWIFSVINICTIISLMLVIELTLNGNYARGVLGGNQATNNGNILTPGQLLPMLIGAFSFVRILYTAWELWRSPNGDITPSLGRNDSRRYSKIQRESAKGLNVFQLFSTGPDGAEAGKRTYSGSHDPIIKLHERLSWWRRIMITWLPWLSLLYFWPWSKDVGHPVPQQEDEIQLTSPTDNTSPNASRRTRFAQYDDGDESESMDAAYHRSSHVSVTDGYAAQRPMQGT